MRRFLVLLLILFAATARAETPSLPWQKWDPTLFDRAAKENKYILLHMAAVWCHWCHVMEDTTYRDPAIQRTILEKFIPVRVDQAAAADRPPLLCSRDRLGNLGARRTFQHHRRCGDARRGTTRLRVAAGQPAG